MQFWSAKHRGRQTEEFWEVYILNNEEIVVVVKGKD